MADRDAAAPPGKAPGDTGSQELSAPTYQSIASHMRTMADQARSDEARVEFARLALLYGNLAARAGSSAYARSDAPPLSAYSGVVRMPLQETYFRYSHEGVISHAPRSPGIYALWNKDFWIYIGESSDIRERLLQHLGGDGVCIGRERPTTFGFELIEHGQERRTRQAALVRDLMPLC